MKKTRKRVLIISLSLIAIICLILLALPRRTIDDITSGASTTESILETGDLPITESPDESLDSTIDESLYTSDIESIDESVYTSSVESIDESLYTSIIESVDESKQASSEAPSKPPVDESEDTPSEAPSKPPVDESKETSSEAPSKPPVDESKETSLEAPSKPPVDESKETMEQGTLFDYAAIENRSVWYRSTEKTEEQVRKTVQTMAAQNINTLYLETWYNGMFIGKTDGLELIKHHPNNGDLDALEAFCRIGHEYGIEVHAWVQNFYIGLDTFDLPKQTVGHHLLDKYGGNTCATFYGNFVFLNPYDQFSRDLVKSVYNVILTEYDVDGINLDYIRFPEAAGKNGSDFGYNDDIIAAFQNEYNTTVDPKTMSKSHSLWKPWLDFRVGIINDWVREMYSFIKERRPEISVSAAVDPSYPNCVESRMQDYVFWVENGWIDEIFTMSYTSNSNEIAASVSRFVGLFENNCFFTIGISGGNNNDIIKTQILAAQNGGSCGVNIFSYGDIINKGSGFTNDIKTVWGGKSVRTDKLNVTVRAYAERLKHDLLAVYVYTDSENEEYYRALNKISNQLIESSKALNEISALSEKTSYCTSTCSELDALLKEIEKCPNANIKKALRKDAEFIKDCIETTKVRLIVLQNELT